MTCNGELGEEAPHRTGQYMYSTVYIISTITILHLYDMTIVFSDCFYCAHLHGILCVYASMMTDLTEAMYYYYTEWWPFPSIESTYKNIMIPAPCQ